MVDFTSVISVLAIIYFLNASGFKERIVLL